MPASDIWIERLSVSAGLMRVGYNELTVEVGRAIPDCQAPGNAWDELLFRRVRLDKAEVIGTPAVSPTPIVPSGGMPVTITRAAWMLC